MDRGFRHVQSKRTKIEGRVGSGYQTRPIPTVTRLSAPCPRISLHFWSASTISLLEMTDISVCPSQIHSACEDVAEKDAGSELLRVMYTPSQQKNYPRPPIDFCRIPRKCQVLIIHMVRLSLFSQLGVHSSSR